MQLPSVMCEGCVGVCMYICECVSVCVCMVGGVTEPPYTVSLCSTPESSLSFLTHYFLRPRPLVVNFSLFARFWSIFIVPLPFFGLVFVSLSLSSVSQFILVSKPGSSMGRFPCLV